MRYFRIEYRNMGLSSKSLHIFAPNSAGQSGEVILGPHAIVKMIGFFHKIVSLAGTRLAR
jgi:hypothetical protein